MPTIYNSQQEPLSNVTAISVAYARRLGLNSQCFDFADHSLWRTYCLGEGCAIPRTHKTTDQAGEKAGNHAGCFARNILVLSADPMINDVSIGVRILLFGRHP